MITYNSEFNEQSQILNSALKLSRLTKWCEKVGELTKYLYCVFEQPA